MNGFPLNGTARGGPAAVAESAGDKVLSALSAFGERPEWDLGGLAARLGLPKSTTHRLLGVLRRHGYVRQLAGSARYALGYQLACVAHSVTPNSVLRATARDALEELARTTGETAFLMVSEGAQAICLDLIEPASPIRFSISVGAASPLHKGSSGRVLLAFGDTRTRQSVLTALDPTERHDLERKLDEVREQGWSYTVGELTPGTGAISAPILTRTATLAGCLVVAGPDERLTLDVAMSLYPRLRQKTAEVAAGLG